VETRQNILMDQARRERPQDYGDLVRLVSTLRALEVGEPGRQAVRDQLLAKLTRVAQDPSAIRGGHQAGGWALVH
jgi:hypothetical protein